MPEVLQESGNLDIEKRGPVVRAPDITVQSIAHQIEVERALAKKAIESRDKAQDDFIGVHDRQRASRNETLERRSYAEWFAHDGAPSTPDAACSSPGGTDSCVQNWAASPSFESKYISTPASSSGSSALERSSVAVRPVVLRNSFSPCAAASQAKTRSASVLAVALDVVSLIRKKYEESCRAYTAKRELFAPPAVCCTSSRKGFQAGVVFNRMKCSRCTLGAGALHKREPLPPCGGRK